MSRWCTIKLVVAPTEEGGEPTTLETSARVLGRAALFQELLEEGETVIPITNFEADDVALFLKLAAIMRATADAMGNGQWAIAGCVKGLLTVEMIERVAPFCEFCGAHELLREMVSWVQCHATVRTARCIEGLASGTFEVEWGEAARKALFAEASTSNPPGHTTPRTQRR